MKYQKQNSNVYSVNQGVNLVYHWIFVLIIVFSLVKPALKIKRTNVPLVQMGIIILKIKKVKMNA